MRAVVYGVGGLAGVALCLLAGGCATNEMKGTPFYSGEYGKRTGPAEQRVNAWPLLYYREPALSVMWPIFEFTDDHTAVRPLLSVYGLDRDRREYNFLWPLSRFDFENHEHYIFPFFWGEDYQVAFPLYWHYGKVWGTNGGADSLFPLWIAKRDTNALSVWSPWPLVHFDRDREQRTASSMILPFYWQGRDQDGSTFVSLPWMSGTGTNGDQWRLMFPLFFESSGQDYSALATPIWAQGHSGTNDWGAVIPLAYWDRSEHTLLSPLWAHWKEADADHDFAPWLLSWKTASEQRSDLWLAAGIAHASWGREPGPNYVFPIYYRNGREHTLRTPLFGWDGAAGYYYPLTPLAGVWNGSNAGSWLLPIYSHKREVASGNSTDTYLLLGGRSHTAAQDHTWVAPLFSYRDLGPLDSVPVAGSRGGDYGTSFWCLPFCWCDNQCSVHEPFSPAHGTADPNQPSSVPPAVEPTPAAANTNRPMVRTYTRDNGAFPIWSHANKSTPAEGRSQENDSLLLLLYDYKHELEHPPQPNTGATNDYTRARVLWHVWHYERLNGNVSVDVFPGFTYDHKQDGFVKTSLLWRLFRYEHAAEGRKKLDVLFVPIVR